LGERLGGEKVEGADLRVGQRRFQHGQVVAEGLARGGAGDHNYVLPPPNGFDGLHLVEVEALHPLGLENMLNLGRQRLGELPVPGPAALEMLDVDDLALVLGGAL